MKDLVEAALRRREDRAHENETESDEFGDPRMLLIGYGETGAEIARQGWDSRYPHPKYPRADIHSVQDGGDVPPAVTDADYVIHTGSTARHDLAAAVGEAVPEGATEIAIPVSAERQDVHRIDAADVCIPCKRKHVQELATDLLTMLTAQIRIAPPPQLYQELRTTRLMRGFCGEQRQIAPETSARERAANLVDDALGNPIYDDGLEHTGDCISFLHAGKDLTLGDAQAVREEVAEQTDSGGRPELFAVDTTKRMDDRYRLTLLSPSKS